MDNDAVFLAKHLADLKPLTKFADFISFYTGADGITLHVFPEYFNKHFSEGVIAYEDLPPHGMVKKSIMRHGVTIFCLEDAQYKYIRTAS